MGKKITPQDFIKLYCDKNGVPADLLFGSSRAFDLVNLRATLVKILIDNWKCKPKFVGELINRERTSVMHLYHRPHKLQYKEPKNPLALLK